MSIKKFLTKFIEGDLSIIHDVRLGLCANYRFYSSSSSEDSLLDVICLNMDLGYYPINDEESGIPPRDQYYSIRNLYEGNQLKLRKELAQKVLDYLTAQENTDEETSST